MEIERRFIVNDVSNLNLQQYEHKQIVQNYLYKDEFTAIRKRKTIENNNIVYSYTVKTNKVGFSVNEIEQVITAEQYNNLKLNDSFNTIDKTRYLIPFTNNLTIELDVFNGNFSGIAFAEIEFESEEQASNITLPSWFGSEISNTITNSDMASMPINQIFKKIQEVH